MPFSAGAVHRLALGDKLDLPEGPVPPGKESYEANISSGVATIAAEADAGLFYGVQTLIQLIEQSRRENKPIPAISIKDSPIFEWRGRYYDCSQYAGTIVTTRANLEREIKLQSRYKLNFLCLEI